MPVTLRQTNVQNTTGALGATMPAWSLSPVAGNLLLVLVSERQSTLGTWPTTPAGYTAVVTTPFVYSSTNGNPFGQFWKIAVGGDATPGTVAESGSTQDWTVITLEFVSPTGWLATPIDKEAHSAATSTATTTKASGSTAALAQASELVVGHLALDAAWAAFTSWSSSALTDITTATTFARAGWLEVAATTAVGTTGTWTTSNVAGCRVMTFKLAAGAAAAKIQQAGSRAQFEDVPSRSASFMTRVMIPVTRFARQMGIPFTPPPDPAGAKAYLTPPLLPQTLSARASGIPFVPPPDPFGASALTPKIPNAVVTPPSIARMAGIPFLFPPDPAGASAQTPKVNNPVLLASAAGIPYKPPPDPFGGQAWLVLSTPPAPPPVVARMAGIPFVPPPDPFGARAYFTQPLIASSSTLGMSAGNRAIFPPDPFGARAFTTFPLIPTTVKFGQSGNGPIFPLDPFGAKAFFTPPLLASVLVSSSAGSRAVFPPDPSGGAAFMLRFTPPQQLGMAFGSSFRGLFESGVSLVWNPLGDGTTPAVVVPASGGGGEWVIWEAPDFPGVPLLVWRHFDHPAWKTFSGFARPDFQRFGNPFPSRRTRREKRGY